MKGKSRRLTLKKQPGGWDHHRHHNPWGCCQSAHRILWRSGGSRSWWANGFYSLALIQGSGTWVQSYRLQIIYFQSLILSTDQLYLVIYFFPCLKALPTHSPHRTWCLVSFLPTSSLLVLITGTGHRSFNKPMKVTDHPFPLASKVCCFPPPISPTHRQVKIIALQVLGETMRFKWTRVLGDLIEVGWLNHLCNSHILNYYRISYLIISRVCKN